jgi:hypothetical protein
MFGNDELTVAFAFRPPAAARLMRSNRLHSRFGESENAPIELEFGAVEAP